MLKVSKHRRLDRFVQRNSTLVLPFICSDFENCIVHYKIVFSGLPRSAHRHCSSPSSTSPRTPPHVLASFDIIGFTVVAIGHYTSGLHTPPSGASSSNKAWGDIAPSSFRRPSRNIVEPIGGPTGVSSTCTTCDTQTRAHHCFSRRSCGKQNAGLDANGRRTGITGVVASSTMLKVCRLNGNDSHLDPREYAIELIFA